MFNGFSTVLQQGQGVLLLTSVDAALGFIPEQVIQRLDFEVDVLLV